VKRTRRIKFRGTRETEHVPHDTGTCNSGIGRGLSPVPVQIAVLNLASNQAAGLGDRLSSLQLVRHEDKGTCRKLRIKQIDEMCVQQQEYLPFHEAS
jgi:hypothetical protein